MSLGGLGAVLERLGAYWGGLRAVLERLGRSWGGLGASWGVLEAVLERLGAFLRRPREPQEHPKRHQRNLTEPSEKSHYNPLGSWDILNVEFHVKQVPR